MPGLPQILVNRCRDALLQCEQFETPRDLRALFVLAELKAFQGDVPNEPTPRKLVEHIVALLADKWLDDGRPVLPLLLVALRDAIPSGDARHVLLSQLVEDVGRYLRSQSNGSIRRHGINQELFQKLVATDFVPQVQDARRALHDVRVGAFLVRGGPRYGQQVLVKRLTRLCSGADTAPRLVLDARGAALPVTAESAWQQLAGQLGEPATLPRSELISRVGEWLETQSVFIVVHAVDALAHETLAAWLAGFWQPLANDVAQASRSPENTRLVLFLVAYALRDTPADAPLGAYQPMVLPPAERFASSVIQSLVENSIELLPPADDLGELVEILMRESDNGVPELVYARLCDVCGTSWEGELAGWLD